MKYFAILLTVAMSAAASAEPQGLRVPGGDPGPSAFVVTDLEVEPPTKRSDGAATAKITLSPARPGVQMREMEIKLLYADRGFGGTGRFRRDAPQPRGLAAGAVRYIAYPDTARLGCIDPLQPRQIVVVVYDEGGMRKSEAHLIPFTWFDRFPTLDGRCHIPTR